MALPLLDAMTPAFAKGKDVTKKPRRMLAICNNLGVLPQHFFPENAGPDYKLSPYLQQLSAHKNDFTVFSGVSHLGVDGGHPADNCFLTAAPHPGSGSFRNTISLDQFMAENIGHHTRIPSLTLGVNVYQGIRGLSWTAGGVLIPSEEKASRVFSQMFLEGSAKEKQNQVRKIELGQSILDTVTGMAKSLESDLGASDKESLDQYFTSVRDLEKRMAASKEWEYKEKPKVSTPPLVDFEDTRLYMDKTRLMYQLSSLAIQTDSTRVISLMLDSLNSPAIEFDGQAISDGYHSLSHHGKSEAKLEQLKRIDLCHMKLLNGLLSDLKDFKEGGQPLLDSSMVLYGSNLGDAQTHKNTNLPIIFAGGGFEHGQHLVFDTERNYPLPNLYVSMLERMGIETDKFASSTGTMRGLEMAG
ncbi:MAG: DUF1552 domain-containing protein [Verrucomicrobiota bacterium]